MALTSDDYRAALPADLGQRVLEIESTDRLHAKQGRSTARVRFDSPWGSLTVYLKRHYKLPWQDRLAALLNPGGRHTPGAAEWAHLQHARRIGVPVPDPVAAGEWIGPWGRAQSFLMVAELSGQEPLHEAIPARLKSMDRLAFERFKRALAAELAQITARLHSRRLFHKDLYLCHFFLEEDPREAAAPRLTLIDLHRLGEHRLTALRWQLKDLGQLLFSSQEVAGITDRDRLRFWSHYRRRLGVGEARLLRTLIAWKAALYGRHNRP